MAKEDVRHRESLHIRLIDRSDGPHHTLLQHLQAPDLAGPIFQCRTFGTGDMIPDSSLAPLETVNISAKGIPAAIEGCLVAFTRLKEFLAFIEPHRHPVVYQLRSRMDGCIVEGISRKLLALRQWPAGIKVTCPLQTGLFRGKGVVYDTQHRLLIRAIQTAYQEDIVLLAAGSFFSEIPGSMGFQASHQAGMHQPEPGRSPNPTPHAGSFSTTLLSVVPRHGLCHSPFRKKLLQAVFSPDSISRARLS